MTTLQLRMVQALLLGSTETRDGHELLHGKGREFQVAIVASVTVDSSGVPPECRSVKKKLNCSHNTALSVMYHNITYILFTHQVNFSN